MTLQKAIAGARETARRQNVIMAVIELPTKWWRQSKYDYCTLVNYDCHRKRMENAVMLMVCWPDGGVSQ